MQLGGVCVIGRNLTLFVCKSSWIKGSVGYVSMLWVWRLRTSAAARGDEEVNHCCLQVRNQACLWGFFFKREHNVGCEFWVPKPLGEVGWEMYESEMWANLSFLLLWFLALIAETCSLQSSDRCCVYFLALQNHAVMGKRQDEESSQARVS